MRAVLLIPLTALWCVQSAVADGQPPQSAPALQLSLLQRDALRADPRARELELQASQTELRLRDLAAERLPSITAQGQMQYQSDVPTAPFVLANGQPPFSPPKDTFDVFVRVDERLFDPTAGPRQALERAQLVESQARVRTALYGVRQVVNDAFFAAALLQEQQEALAVTIAEIEARLGETRVRVQEGSALAADAAVLEATLLQRRQDDLELGANRQAALARLATETGRVITTDDTLALPDLDHAVVEARSRLALLRTRPEYEQFQRARERLGRQQEVAAAQDRPHIGLFARAGYGKPGLNFIGSEFQPYGLAGIQVQWKAWTWGSTARAQEVLALQQEIVDAEQASFTKNVGENVLNDLATIDRLQAGAAMDDRIIVLREQVDRTTQVRFSERVITASEYLDRNAELLRARIARASHRVERAQASARLLNTLGLEVQ